MILCVTLNPCLDKTLTVPEWRQGDIQVRGHEVRYLVGGKGNNVARALTRLGRPARPVTFFGGAIGRRCAETLRDHDGLDPLVVETEAETRVIVTIRTSGTDHQTAFFDPDPALTEADADALHRAIAEALNTGSIELVTLSGSSPSESTHHLYSDLIALAKARRVPVFLDTYGPAFKAIWGFWPDVVQMNRREAALSMGLTGRASDEDVRGLLLDWARHGVQIGLVTDGPEAVLAIARGEWFRLMPPWITAVNPIGSGDCLLAGLADGWLAGLGPEALLRRGMGCAVSNALTWDAGAVDPDALRDLEAQVEVESLGAAGAENHQVQLVRKTLGRKR